MRQSGFFDLVVGMMILALVLGILWGIGLISYNATFHAHAVLAAGDGPVPATLEEAGCCRILWSITSSRT